MNTVVVTRHKALVEWLVLHGIIDADTPVIMHATADAVRGKGVIGVLPLHLAAEAECLTSVDMFVPMETYIVKRVNQ